MKCNAEDCVSRTEVIDYLCKHCPDDRECFKDCDEIKHLRNISSIYPKSDKSAFTLEELELLDQCLSKHFYSISGTPNTVVSCAEKIQKLKERIE